MTEKSGKKSTFCLYRVDLSRNDQKKLTGDIYSYVIVPSFLHIAMTRAIHFVDAHIHSVV